MVPVKRSNLESEMTDFVAELLGFENGGTPDEWKTYRDFSRSLIVHVLDAHLRAAMDEGRQAAYADHHAAPHDPNPSGDSPS